MRASSVSSRPSKSTKKDPGPRPALSAPSGHWPFWAFWGDCCPISPQAAPGHTPATPGPGAVFPGPPGPGIAAVGLPPQPRQLRAEPATPSPAGRLLALAGEQPGAAPGSTSGARAFCALAHLLRRAPAPHVSARRGGDYCRGRGLREEADPQG